MNGSDLRLDGNAAGGLLNEIFPFEMTAADATCAGLRHSETYRGTDALQAPHGLDPSLRRLRHGGASDYAHSRMLPAGPERYQLSSNRRRYSLTN
jgi:hypothetical protein